MICLIEILGIELQIRGGLVLPVGRLPLSCGEIHWAKQGSLHLSRERLREILRRFALLCSLMRASWFTISRKCLGETGIAHMTSLRIPLLLFFRTFPAGN